MLNLLIAIALFVPSSAFAAQDAEVTLCGQFELKSSDGMMQVITPLLLVPVGRLTPAFSVYRLVASCRSAGECEARYEMIDKMINGKRYCVTGVVQENGSGRADLIPNSVEVQGFSAN